MNYTSNLTNSYSRPLSFIQTGCGKLGSIAVSTVKFLGRGLVKLDDATLKIYSSSKILKKSFAYKDLSSGVASAVRLLGSSAVILTALSLLPDFGQKKPISSSTFAFFQTSLLASLYAEVFSMLKMNSLKKISVTTEDVNNSLPIHYILGRSEQKKLAQVRSEIPQVTNNSTERLFNNQITYAALFSAALLIFGGSVAVYRQGLHIVVGSAAFTAARLARAFANRNHIQKLEETVKSATSSRAASPSPAGSQNDLLDGTGSSSGQTSDSRAPSPRDFASTLHQPGDYVVRFAPYRAPSAYPLQPTFSGIQVQPTSPQASDSPRGSDHSAEERKAPSPQLSLQQTAEVYGMFEKGFQPE